MAAYLWIAVGSALGGVARYWCSGVAARFMGETFPWGTIIVNIVGSFSHRLLRHDHRPRRPHLRRHADQQFVMIGVLGGYTTFSSFSLQTLNLVQDGEWWLAGANVVLSVVACLVAVWLGFVLAASINSLKWI